MEHTPRFCKNDHFPFHFPFPFFIVLSNSAPTPSHTDISLLGKAFPLTTMTTIDASLPPPPSTHHNSVTTCPHHSGAHFHASRAARGRNRPISAMQAQTTATCRLGSRVLFFVRFFFL
jgi:hypothetical protein